MSKKFEFTTKKDGFEGHFSYGIMLHEQTNTLPIFSTGIDCFYDESMVWIIVMMNFPQQMSWAIMELDIGRYISMDKGLEKAQGVGITVISSENPIRKEEK